jgi:hypothetical protein
VAEVGQRPQVHVRRPSALGMRVPKGAKLEALEVQIVPPGLLAKNGRRMVHGLRFRACEVEGFFLRRKDPRGDFIPEPYARSVAPSTLPHSCFSCWQPARTNSKFVRASFRPLLSRSTMLRNRLRCASQGAR